MIFTKDSVKIFTSIQDIEDRAIQDLFLVEFQNHLTKILYHFHENKKEDSLIIRFQKNNSITINKDTYYLN